MKIRNVSFVVAALSLFATALCPAEIHEIATVRGKTLGRSAVLLVPAGSREKTITAARQVAAWEIPTGKLTIYEYDAPTTETSHLEKALTEIQGSPDVLIAVVNDLEPLSKKNKRRVPSLLSGNGALGTQALNTALADSFEEVPKIKVASSDQANLQVLRFSPKDTVHSRIDRWTRLFVYNTLGEFEMAPDREAMLDSMSQSDLSYALYDAEGVGGSGPTQLEKIIDQKMDATVTYVCPEDVRDGILPRFDGVLFPGGSGKSIAGALGETGQEEVRQFVHGGGGYVGICAGAYLASCRIEGYLNMAGAYHNQPWLKGGAVLDIELTPEGEALFGSEYKEFKTRYNNGPIFGHEDGSVPVGDFAPMQVLAKFRSASTNPKTKKESTEMIDQAAITSTTYGSGRVLMISPHPETHETLFPLVMRGLLWSVKRLDVPNNGGTTGG